MLLRRLSYLKNNDGLRAYRELNSASKIDMFNDDVFAYKAAALLKLERFVEACGAAEMAIDLNPKNALPYRLRAYAKEYSRSIQDIDIVREVSLSMADTKEVALKAYLNSPAQAHMRSLSKGKKLIDFEAENRVSLIGTAEDIIEGIQAYMNAGVTHFMFNIAVRKPQDLITGMKKFVGKVLPSFR